MKIKKITEQHRRDFWAILECEHCGATETCCGYDDRHYHQNVIPKMKCEACGKIAPATHRPLAPKHADDVTI